MHVWRCPATLAQIMSRHCCTLAYYGTVELGWWGVSALVGYTIFTEDQWEVGYTIFTEDQWEVGRGPGATGTHGRGNAAPGRTPAAYCVKFSMNPCPRLGFL